MGSAAPSAWAILTLPSIVNLTSARKAIMYSKTDSRQACLFAKNLLGMNFEDAAKRSVDLAGKKQGTEHILRSTPAQGCRDAKRNLNRRPCIAAGDDGTTAARLNARWEDGPVSGTTGPTALPADRTSEVKCRAACPIEASRFGACTHRSMPRIGTVLWLVKLGRICRARRAHKWPQALFALKPVYPTGPGHGRT